MRHFDAPFSQYRIPAYTAPAAADVRVVVLGSTLVLVLLGLVRVLGF